MAAKIITALILLLANLGLGFFFFLMLGLSLNGFSERDTNWSFIIYIAGVIVLLFLSIGLGVLAVHLLVVKKGFSAIVSTLGVSILFSTLVVIADFALILIGAIIAIEVRKKLSAMKKTEEKINNYAEFWDFYVREHSQPLTRYLHFVGTMLGIVLLIWFARSGNWYYFPLCFVVGYAFAWFSHFFVEKNKPATFKYPLWSFISDYKMMFYMLTGKMNREVERVSAK